MGYKDPDYQKKYREKNKERHKETNRIWYQKNKEKILERVKNYRINNIEKIKEYDKERYKKSERKEQNKRSGEKYRINNVEKIREEQKIWRKNNIEKIKARRKTPKYQEYMKEYIKGKPQYDRFKWFTFRYNFLKNKKLICNSCLKKLKYNEVKVDHIKCRKLYPELAYKNSNLQILCNTCHQHKTWCDIDLIKRINNKCANLKTQKMFFEI